MILYLDTSALVKLYFEEPHSGEVLEKWRQAEAAVTSTVAYAETLAAIRRKAAESDLAADAAEHLARAFRRDWPSLIRVDVTDALSAAIDRVLEKRALRGFDAIHLASALAVQKRLPKEFFFACFDTKLNQAAASFGLETF